MKDKPNIRDFVASRGKGGDENNSQSATAKIQEKNTASPLLNKSSKQGPGFKRTERKSLRLPVSGKNIELTAIYKPPGDCLIHRCNQRVQRLLRIDNPAIASLLNAIKEEGQREPVLARWVEQDGEKKLEILDGSRRRFCVAHLHENNSSLLLTCWVGDIGDKDAEHLAKSGNKHREDISPWEIAQYLRDVEIENPSWSHEVIAQNEGMSRTSVYNHLALADIPIEVIELLESPDLLKINSGLQVAKLIRNYPMEKYIGALKSEAPYAKFSELAKNLKALVKKKKPADTPTANKKVEIKNGNSLRAEIGRNRSKIGQYKVDLYDVSDDEYEKLVDAMRKVLG